MKICENKKLFKKIIWFLLILIIVSFCFTGEVNAKDDTVGGKLLKPISDFIVFVGDSFMNIIHGVIYKQWDTTITTNLLANAIEHAIAIAAGIVAAVAVAALVVVTAGAVLAAIPAAMATASIGAVITITVTAATGAGIITGVALFNSDLLPDVLELPVYQISPEEIFSNKILLLDVNFFNPKEDKVLTGKNGQEIKDDDGNPIYQESTARQLREVISNWYTVLRDIAVVALLSILVYIGIHIVISSTANDKAKYKQLLVDWIVALCLLFVMQYIMSFANLFVEKITDLLDSSIDSNAYVALLPDKDNKIYNRLKKLGGYDVSSLQSEYDGVHYISWQTNLVGIARLNAQYAMKESPSYAGYGIIFFVLVLYTIYFLFTYLKRVLYMAFLTIIAPLVAMTYPIDKINDGKAQAFNMWLKEYIFNLLIQPMHLILYTVLVTSAFKLASENIIYSLVAIGFMVPAEKLLRKFFGFEKAQTPGLLAGPAGAAITMEAMKHLFGKPPKGMDNKANSKSNSESSSDDAKPIKQKDNFNNEDEFFGTDNSNSNQGDNDSQNSNHTQNGELPGPNGGLPGPTKDDDNIIDLSEDEYQISNADDDNSEQESNDRNNHVTDDNENVGKDNTGYKEKETSTKDDKKAQRKIRRKSYKSALGTGLKYYGKGMAKNMANAAKNKIKNAHPLRFAAGMTAGATFGMMGMAAGIASGDLSKAAQYSTAAATGGYKFGRSTAQAIGSFAPNDVKDITERSMYATDDEYNEVKKKQYIKEFQKNDKNKFELERKYGKEESKRIMKEDVPILMQNGITDIEDIKAVEDLVRDKDAEKITTIKKAIATKNMADRVGNTEKMKDDDVEKWRKTLKKDYDNSEKWKDRDTEEMSTEAMKAIRAYNRIRFK